MAIPPPPPGFVPMGKVAGNIPPPPPGFVPISSTPEPQQEGPKPSVLQRAISNSVPGGGGITDPLGAIARAGGIANKGNQDLADLAAEKAGYYAAKTNLPKPVQEALIAPAVLGGTMLGTASEFALPQNRLAAGLTLIPGAAKAAQLGREYAPSVSEGLSKAPAILRSLLGKTPQIASEASAFTPAIRDVNPIYKNGVLINDLRLQQARQAAQEALGSNEAVINLHGEELVNPEQIVSAIRNAKNVNADPMAGLTAKERALAKTAGDRMLLARDLTGRASEGLNESEKAFLKPSTPLYSEPLRIPEEHLDKVSQAEKNLSAAEKASYDRFNKPPLKPTQIESAVPSPEPSPVSTYKTPTKLQRAVAEGLSTQSGANPNHVAAVVANPEIMSEATPTTKAVGELYQAKFKEHGIKFDSNTYREITGNALPPRGSQLDKMETIVNDAYRALKENGKLDPSQAFIARSASAKLRMGISDPNYLRVVDELQGSFDKALEASGVPGIKELSQQYFRASAKEALSGLIPRNKWGSPSAVRGFIMAKYGADAASALGKGHYTEALVKGGTAAMMSPLIQGNLIKGISGNAAALANPINRRLALQAGVGLSNIAGK